MMNSIPSEPAVDPPLTGWNLKHSYAGLPEAFYQDAEPTAVKAPAMVAWNETLAGELGLHRDETRSDAVAGMLAGNVLPPGSRAIAQAYAGHQFGGFTMLGDGRAILLGEQITPSGDRVDVQLKGAGRTLYSRGGDGRAALGPMLREYLISEAMHALGISTARALAVVTTGESVYRETPLPGAILTRVAASHVRVGTFQYAAGREDSLGLRTLADYVINRHFPELATQDDRYLGLLAAVSQRQAELIASWMLVGFIHGVMNTDNVSIAGETIDYGPCAFMDRYHAETVFSSIDQQGRYAFGNQPVIMQWNLARFAETLLPLIDEDSDAAVESATEVLHGFEKQYQTAWLSGMRPKLGLGDVEEADEVLAGSLLDWMTNANADFTNTFDGLARARLIEQNADADNASLESLKSWYAVWQQRRSRDRFDDTQAAAAMRSHNPAIIPRNHLVESALAAAGENDWKPWDGLLSRVRDPFTQSEVDSKYREPAGLDGPDYRTFCGT